MCIIVAAQPSPVFVHILSVVCVITMLALPANAQKDDVEWLYPPGPSNDIFNQAFGPPDFFGPAGPGQDPFGGQGQGPLGGGQGPPGQGPIGGNSPGYKVCR